MPTFIKNWVNQVTMYQLMLYFLRILIGLAVILSFLEILKFTWWHILLQAIYLPFACWIFNWVFARIFKVKTNFESQFITAEILTLIVGPLNPVILSNLAYLTALGFLAMGSKYIFAFRRRHFFNPAAFAVLTGSLMFGIGASWWVGNIYLLPVVVLGGLLMIRKMQWGHLVFSFLITYVGFLLVTNANLSFLLHSAIFFFTFVMLIEPLTSPPGKKLKISYGIFIGAVLALSQKFLSGFPYTLEASLLVGNLAFAWARSSRLNLTLVEKQNVAKNIYSFWFEPIKKINFLPGQFLEWSLAHPNADSRGTRRWFTIAASPTENKLMITTKFSEKGSSFKQTLSKMEPGSEIIAFALEGDFTLPQDQQKKLAFVAGGIGITPYRSMIKYLLDINEKRNIVLIYTAKSAEEFAFKDIFERSKSIGVEPIYLETDKEGFLSAEKVQQLIPDWRERLFYVSGPEPMVESYEKMFKDAGIKEIKTDFFPGYANL